ncbi:hypothetical protein PACTADRAFT_65551 [Pachysolen tannophilus NRRL Y-2460]|uniref:Uncharacterized protein n=1 Tax=Pachysolen tannophilus NRRL Y-2460 TaxID=669874 RepID=A0A1E4TYU9_PACTA|nr:hypothetical protein PACTADRAFT_65551 [Pachysolen tannophilus NRRL Y-2460]
MSDVELNESEAEVVGRALIAIVDIGSNGIRFSISSKAPHHLRIMPCVFKDRVSISLFDAQLPPDDSLRLPIPDSTIEDVCFAMKRFKLICDDFGVPPQGVKVVATEATREASNSKEFREAISKSVGWNVELLSKEDEGRCGAYGVASSFNEVSGLFMDVGGGSTQISWIVSKNGEVKISDHPVSLSYGAAALTYRLKYEDPKIIFNEIKQAYKLAMKKIEIPNELIEEAERKGGFDLYTCGGGFRGFGHLILAENPTYPIPTIINGYSTSFTEVVSMANYLFLKKDIPLLPNSSKQSDEIFRVSKRRRAQLPAVGLLISAAAESLPRIKTVHFSQGGVREGVLYAMTPSSVRAEDPLITASKPYAPLLANKYLELLRNALPKSQVPDEVYYSIAPALCDLAFVHCSYPKELQPTAALHVATTGIIAGSHGLSHKVRALIGLACSDRWGFDLPESEENYASHLENLVILSEGKILGSKLIYWTKYCGKIMHVICGVHPGGNIRPGAINFRVVNDDFGKNDTAAGSAFNENPQIRNTNTNATDEKYLEVMVELSPDDIKTSASVRGRILSLQKKIKKMNKQHNGKVKIGVEYVHDPNSINLI